MSEQFSRWDPVDQLQSEEDMAMYLDACLEEDPGDGSVVRAALNDIARAQGMTQLAKATESPVKASTRRSHPPATRSSRRS
jgi:probable addiction module antidote protein